MIKIEKILSLWWKRILFFFFLTYIFYLIIDYLAIKYFYSIIYFYYDWTFSLFIAILISSIITERFRYKKYMFSFGLSFTDRTIFDIIIGFLLVLIPFAILTLFINFMYFKELRYSTVHNGFIYFTIYIFIASAYEELIFRGVIFQALLDKIGVCITLLISSFVFTTFHLFNNHFNLISFINTFLAGMILGIMYIQTKSLYMPISYHFFWNYLQELILNSNISGNSFDFSFFSQDFCSLPALFFGGYYGFEGGLIATIVLIITAIVVLFIAKPSAYITSNLLKRKILESFL